MEIFIINGIKGTYTSMFEYEWTYEENMRTAQALTFDNKDKGHDVESDGKKCLSPLKMGFDFMPWQMTKEYV
ncbi:MAG: hypothetical protein U9P49_05630 [Thermodesulfobacteriota bacterium]|nr:hypothetical protein [Thermodesulfobacteriota bacterium]